MNEYILLVPNKQKKHIIKEVKQKYYNYNIKFMSLEEFIKRVTFTYDKETLYNVMKEYNLNYSAAKVYLDNLLLIDNNINSDKMNKLKDIKKYLEDNKLLKYDNLFKDYAKDKEIYIYGYYYIEKKYQKILKQFNVKVINPEYKNFNNLKIYKFNTLFEEVVFVVNRIAKLLKNNIDINKIKIIAPSEYYEELYRVCMFNNIKIDLPKNNIYSIKEVKDLLNNLENYEEYLNKITDSKVKDKIINILNDYTFTSLFEVKELISEDIKNINIKNNIGIKLTSLEDPYEEDDNVFLLGFNKENIPVLYKDNEYFSDKEKDLLEVDTSLDLNIKLKEKTSLELNNINNLTVTYKLNSGGSIYTKSDLLPNEDLVPEENIYENSNILNKIILTEKLDDLIKYNVIDKDLGVLLNKYSDIPYMNYDNKYKKIDKDNLYKFLDNKLLMSYTSLENYNKCSFKYYLDNILKLNIIKDDFAIIIGNICHYVLSKISDKDFNVDKYYDEYLKELRPLTSKEKFILENIREELKIIVDIIINQDNLSTFDKKMYEKEVYINKNRSIKVTFKGVIDKVSYKEENENTYLVVIDYKTGNNKTDLSLMKYGLGMQLPIYLYLAKNTDLNNVTVVGFYLQKLFNTSLDNTKDYKLERENSLRLEGYSINNENILSMFDTTYQNSRLIKGMKTSSKGFYKYSKVLSEDKIDKLIEDTDKIINNTIDNILEADFTINPKIINNINESCTMCNYRDICYRKEEDFIYINKEKEEEENE